MYKSPDERALIFDVYDAVWPGFSSRLKTAERLGYAWQDVTTPFVSWQGDVAQGHVGVLELPMLAAGRRMLFACIHAVCTRPEARGRGAFRGAMEHALRHIDSRAKIAFLTTGQPELYERFGFRLIEERVARIQNPERCAGPLMRPLAGSPWDLHRLRAAMLDRTPVSEVLYARHSGWAPAINEILESNGLGRFWLAEDLEAVVAWELMDRRLILLDVFCQQLPSLSAIPGRIPAEFDEVELWVGADRLAPDAPTVPFDPGEPDRLMVRGQWPIAAGQPVVMPMLNRC